MAADLQFSLNVMSATGNFRNWGGRVSWGQWEPCCGVSVVDAKASDRRDPSPGRPRSDDNPGGSL